MEKCIKKLGQHPRVALIEELLQRSLAPVFEAAGVKDDERRVIAEEIALGLLSIEEKVSASAGTTEQASASDPGPMPTREELEAGGDEKGRLYRQVRTRENITIIQHLKNVWWPWIEAGVLTRPELFRRDPTAYHALVAWIRKPGNPSLQKELGHDIPSKSDIIDGIAATTAPRERPYHVEVALRRRAERSKKDQGIGS